MTAKTVKKDLAKKTIFEALQDLAKNGSNLRTLAIILIAVYVWGSDKATLYIAETARPIAKEEATKAKEAAIKAADSQALIISVEIMGKFIRMERALKESNPKIQIAFDRIDAEDQKARSSISIFKSRITK